MEERDSFIFYKSFYEAIQEVDNNTQLEVLKAICELALYGKDTNLNGVGKIMFTLIKPQIEANTKRYTDGKKGGRPKKETDGFKKEKTSGFENKKPNKNNNVNENVNVNDNENNNNNENDFVSDSCVDGLQDVINFYNQNIGMITPYGLEVLSDFSNEMSKDLIILALKKAVEANIRTIQYIKGILNNWSKKGIKTVLEAEQEDEKFRNKNKPVEENTEEEKQKKIQDRIKAMEKLEAMKYD